MNNAKKKKKEKEKIEETNRKVKTRDFFKKI